MDTSSSLITTTEKESVDASPSKGKSASNNNAMDADVSSDPFFSLSFNPKKELENQGGRLGKSKMNIDWERVKQNDTLYISSLFDMCEWWKTIGRIQHDLIFLVVAIIISLPASNGFQERIFSSCTWFDDPLRQSLGDDKFEKSVLLSVNQVLLDGLDKEA